MENEQDKAIDCTCRYMYLPSTVSSIVGTIPQQRYSLNPVCGNELGLCEIILSHSSLHFWCYSHSVSYICVIIMLVGSAVNEGVYHLILGMFPAIARLRILSALSAYLSTKYASDVCEPHFTLEWHWRARGIPPMWLVQCTCTCTCDYNVHAHTAEPVYVCVCVVYVCESVRV